MDKPYRVCGGLQDNGTWCGPTRTRGRMARATRLVQCRRRRRLLQRAGPDTDPSIIYSESQGGNVSRLNFCERRVLSIMRGNAGRINFEDSLIVARGDTTQPVTSTSHRRSMRFVLAPRRIRSSRYRFNWSAPFFLSSHSPTTLYMGGNRLLKSTDRGDDFYPISPIFRPPIRCASMSARRRPAASRAMQRAPRRYGTITTVSESPIRPGIFWVGTDDGNVWLTTNDGGTWTDLTKRFPGSSAEDVGESRRAVELRHCHCLRLVRQPSRERFQAVSLRLD